MSILTEWEINEIADKCKSSLGGVWPHAFYEVAEAMILAKLAGMEMPDPFGLFCGVRHGQPKTKEFWGMLNEGADNRSKCNLYTAAQLHQAYAQGAASQLAQVPFGIWHVGDTKEESDFFLFDDSGDVSCERCIKLYAVKGSES